MIRNPRIKLLSNDILISLNKLIGIKINDETLPSQRGRLIEQYICNYMKSNNLVGFDSYYFQLDQWCGCVKASLDGAPYFCCALVRVNLTWRQLTLPASPFHHIKCY